MVPKGRHCWFHDVSDGHILSAEELATGLRKYKIKGISTAIEVDAKDFKSKISGKKGIVFFKDYWLRSEDRKGSPTGDHIDL